MLYVTFLWIGLGTVLECLDLSNRQCTIPKPAGFQANPIQDIARKVQQRYSLDKKVQLIIFNGV